MPLVLGIDSSTQATKVEVRDADNGQLVASSRAPHPRASPPRSEQDPAAWWQALVRAVHETGVRDIAAVSVGAQQHGLVCLDSAGAVLRPAKLWNDTESSVEADAMVQEFGAARWARTTGLVPVASFTVTKLAWLARHEPDVLARLHSVLVPHDYLIYRLTGRVVTDRGDASGTGYWSPFEGRWRPDLLDAVVGPVDGDGWAGRLPTVLGPSKASDWVGASVHELLGLRGRPLCGAGTGDNMAAALGMALETGEVAVSLGTSGTVFTVAEGPVADPSGAVAGFADATGRYLPLVATLNATHVTDAVARLLAVDHAAFDQLALDAAPGAGGLTLLPYFDGERTPNLPDASGLLRGLRSNVTREQLARAAFEGVVCSLLDGLDAVAAAGVPVTERPLVLVGGGAQSQAYRRVLADLAGTAVRVPRGAEHVATGACVQAAAALAETDPRDVAEAWGLGSDGEAEIVEPDPNVDAAAVRAAHAAARADSY